MATALHGFAYLVQGTGSHDIVVNEFMDQTDKSLNGHLTKAVGGGVDVTLTTADWNNRVIQCTGTLTGNINVIVPVTTRFFGVYNNTTGDFTLTVKTASGSGILIPRGSRAILTCDGTNVVLYTQSLSTDITLSGVAARTISMERHLTSNTAGNTLTDQAGGATTGATDKAGGARIIKPGLGTGNAIPGLIRLQGDAASATSGTTDHAQVDRFIPNAFKVLTDGSPIDILSATIASNSAIGGVIHYTIEATDGTDFQVETGSVYYSAVNKAGAVTPVITEINSQQAVSAGTLTSVWAMSSANPAVISVNADTDLTPSTGYPRITFSVLNFGQQAVALV